MVRSEEKVMMFFFKQKTAYEMRISDWSSDVCSSDLRGSGAHGVFECTRAIPELTKASIFQKEGASCPVFVRFSTVAGGAGSVDTPRDVRGFAVKLYTETGNWDLVGNNIPVFFIQDR